MVTKLINDDDVKRTFVLDTNVFLYDPNSLYVFKEHDVVVPITVIKRLIGLKRMVMRQVVTLGLFRESSIH